MYLTTLNLFTFRNYRRQELTFHPRINIFSGLNAQGKTNLLEAVYFLTVSRSFRTNQESDLPSFGSDSFSLKGALQKKGERSGIELYYRVSRALRIVLNGKTVPRSEYIYRHPVVIFTPDDLLLIKEGPGRRRRFLDTEGSRLKPLYLRRLRDYSRVLRQRNRVLKERRSGRIVDYSPMEPWDEALVKLGGIIVRERIKLLEALQTQARPHYGALSGGGESLSLHYRPTIKYGDDPAFIEQSFQEQLREGYRTELRTGSTMTGPHLDDFAVTINGVDARKFASQGQQRSVVLSLKIGEVELFKKTGEETILLLDDIFSEFDEKRSAHLLQFLSEREGQSFITTASPQWAGGGRRLRRARAFSVHGGKIRID